jgi:hypothetical protein
MGAKSWAFLEQAINSNDWRILCEREFCHHVRPSQGPGLLIEVEAVATEA